MMPTGAVGPSLGIVIDDRAPRRKLKAVAAIEAEAADAERTILLLLHTTTELVPAAAAPPRKLQR
jgi:hypothetical protein